MNQHTPPSKSVERGSSLIEVLVALLIMLFLMIGVLQLFSMAYLVNLGAGARTEMTSKAEQVMENIRYLHYLTKPTTTGGLGQTVPTALGSLGISFPLTADASGTLDPTVATYWGPTGANVFDTSGDNKSPYMITYSIVKTDPYFDVTVSVTPSTVSGARAYLGAAISRKRVDYVSQMAQ